MTHHIESIAGFTGAAVSTALLWLGQVTPPEVAPWVQLGGTVSLIGCLVYACRSLKAENLTLASALRDADAARLKDAKESLDQYKVDMAKAEVSRAELIKELRAQTTVMRHK